MRSPVEQIKQRLSVADVVGSYIKLQKAGANFKAPCPFHSEKSPSFYVSPSRDVWHCFGCNRGGDIFEFVKEIENVEFPEALRILADRAGVKIVFEKPELISERTRLLDLIGEAAVFYQKRLSVTDNALRYLRERGLKNETLKNFQLGFAPFEEAGWRNLVSFLKSRGYGEIDAEKAGLAVRKDSGSFYDRFRGRIMFPLKDFSGRIVGFSGRILGLEKEGVGKYINTPQTVLYDKSKILYGFDRAKTEIRKNDFCVLVEGQMDVLMSHQAGVVNAVAVSGTALTPFHLSAIKRLSSNLIMAFDGDEAGLTAASRSIDMALRNEFEVRAVLLKDAKDPAELALKDPRLWGDSVKNAVHIIDFYLNILKNRYGVSGQMGFKSGGDEMARSFVMGVEKNVFPYLSVLRSEVEKSHWISKIAREIFVSEEVIWSQLKKTKNPFETEKCLPQGGVGGSFSVSGRKEAILRKLAGIEIWKKENKFISDFARPFIADFLAGISSQPELDKLSIEAELYYAGSEKFEEEAEYLSKELKKEVIKEKLFLLTEEMKHMENNGVVAEKEISGKLEEFQRLSFELARL